MVPKDPWRAMPAGIERMESPYLVRDPAPLREWCCERELRRLIRDWKPDVVHTHSSKAGILGRRAAWTERVPAVVHTVHGMPFHRHQVWPLRKLYMALERHAAKRCHALPVVSWSMRDHDQAVGTLTSTLVRSGMDVEAFKPQTTPISSGVWIPCRSHGHRNGIAYCRPQGHDDLLHAMPVDATRRTSSSALRMVGEEAALLFEKLGLADRIVVTGMLPSSKIPR